MEAYILKTVLCSGIIIGFYYLMLEQQKCHHFKRFFLIAGILFALLVPLASVSYGTSAVAGSQLVAVAPSDGRLEVPEQVSRISITDMIAAVYAIVGVLLLIRFILSLNLLRKAYIGGKKIRNDGCTLVLTTEKIPPYSFLNFIFLNENDYKAGSVDGRVLLHEHAHIRQRHTWDVLFIEVLLIVFWFNPAFYIFKKGILTNHEFLADEAVLKQENDIPAYQKLLLNQLIYENISFTQQFNFINTKKRIKMMTKKSDLKSKTLPWVSLPVAVTLFFAFAEKVPAQKLNNEAPATKESFNEAVPVKDKSVPVVKDTVKTNQRTKTAEPQSDKATKPAIQSAVEQQQKIEDGYPSSPPTLDVPAEYPGGLNTFRTLFAKEFNTAKLNGEEGLIKTVLYFDVDEKGNVSNYRAEGTNEAFNNEAIRTMAQVNGNTPWKPAARKGEPVAFTFRMPLTMNFEKNPAPGDSKK